MVSKPMYLPIHVTFNPIQFPKRNRGCDCFHDHIAGLASSGCRYVFCMCLVCFMCTLVCFLFKDMGFCVYVCVGILVWVCYICFEMCLSSCQHHQPFSLLVLMLWAHGFMVAQMLLLLLFKFVASILQGMSLS